MIPERAATRIYVLTLRAFPRRHRATYTAEMIDTFERELGAQRRGRGPLRALAFAIAACLNVVSAGLGERRRQRRAGFTASTGFSWLDVVLAWRMLVRYPGLSLVGVFGMAVGIAIATGAFTIASALMDARLPLAEGERVVSLSNWDAATNNREVRLLHDLTSWQEMKSVEDIGVTRTVERNLIVEGKLPETVTVAEISASAFRVARVAALRGRHLLPEDERAGAPDAIVIGHDEWRRRFAADPDIVGRSVQLGSATYAIVGVMPEGFAFPVSHSFWIPWRLQPSAYEPRTGPVVSVFGRLAPGATLESAQAELTAIGQRLAAASPGTHQHLRPRVLPYTYAFNDMDDPENALALRAIQVAIVLLLVIVCVNVAILVYARTATRQGEIAVRGALGASRRRIVAQLFVEALMLASVAAALGIGLLSIALGQLDAALIVLAGRLPFWMAFRLSADSAVAVVALTLLAAAIVGVAPALKATGRHVHTRLQGLSPGSGSRMQMGRLWTTLIVAQVALTVALLPATLFHAWSALRFHTGDAGFASRQFLTAELLLDRASAASPTAAGEREFASRYGLVQAELEQRLQNDPAVSDVTFSMAGPGQERALVLEAEGLPAPLDPVDYNIVEGSKRGHLVRFNRVGINFFDAFDVPVVMGRGFQQSDAGLDTTRTTPAVLVNRSMVDTQFGGANPLGRRIRYVGRSREADARDVELERWYEIVGVVPDFPTVGTLDVVRVSRVYHAAAPGDVYPATLSVRVRGAEPGTFAGPLRVVTAAVDPNLQLRDLSTADDALRRDQGVMRLIGFTLTLVILSVVALSAAGIYALMSFTVARRRREIGIRAALGANRNRILAGIFSRVFGQLAIGASVGMFGAIGLEQLLEGEMFQGQGAVILPMVAAFITMVGLLAALGPARKGLSIQPTEALREE
jgi:putative ABC transport system permease protein